MPNMQTVSGAQRLCPQVISHARNWPPYAAIKPDEIGCPARFQLSGSKEAADERIRSGEDC